jgi:hypothetical protein
MKGLVWEFVTDHVIHWAIGATDKFSINMARAKVPGGWLILITNDVLTQTPGGSKMHDRGMEYRQNGFFYPDPLHSWQLEDIEPIPASAETPAEPTFMVEAERNELQERINEFMRMSMQPFIPTTIMVKGRQEDGTILLAHHPQLPNEIKTFHHVMKQMNYKVVAAGLNGESTVIKLDADAADVAYFFEKKKEQILDNFTAITSLQADRMGITPIPIYDTIFASIGMAIEGYDTATIPDGDIIKILSAQEVGVDIGINNKREAFMLTDELLWQPITLLPAKVDAPAPINETGSTLFPDSNQSGDQKQESLGADIMNTLDDMIKDPAKVLKLIQNGLLTAMEPKPAPGINIMEPEVNDGSRYRLVHGKLTRKEKTALKEVVASLGFIVSEENSTDEDTLIILENA